MAKKQPDSTTARVEWMSLSTGHGGKGKVVPRASSEEWAKILNKKYEGEIIHFVVPAKDES